MRRGLKDGGEPRAGRGLLHSSIFPDEEGTERLPNDDEWASGLV